ncbi:MULTISPECIES: hypothetical protein [Stenotrophomonas]|uniref:hypothetical protein n=1 Tax=Stenotrophomonas TaxID=40323 RepID=UPI000C244491|nr:MULTISPECIES: hypothetical protein [Stenotrophomonas]
MLLGMDVTSSIALQSRIGVPAGCFEGGLDAMEDSMQDLEVEVRLRVLERQVGQWPLRAAAMFVLGISMAMADFGLARPESGIVPEIRTQRLIVLDREGRKRVEIGEDAPDLDIKRNARVAGLIIFDGNEQERGGVVTDDLGSATVALDAPRGVGYRVSDRAGMKVGADGSAFVGVLSNAGGFAASLAAKDAEGRLELSRVGFVEGSASTRVITLDGDSTTSSGRP